MALIVFCTPSFVGDQAFLLHRDERVAVPSLRILLTSERIWQQLLQTGAAAQIVLDSATQQTHQDHPPTLLCPPSPLQNNPPAPCPWTHRHFTLFHRLSVHTWNSSELICVVTARWACRPPGLRVMRDAEASWEIIKRGLKSFYSSWGDFLLMCAQLNIWNHF